MVLYPEEGISQIQKLQMTSAPGPNVCVLGKLVSVFLWHSKEKKITVSCIADPTLNHLLESKLFIWFQKF